MLGQGWLVLITRLPRCPLIGLVLFLFLSTPSTSRRHYGFNSLAFLLQLFKPIPNLGSLECPRDVTLASDNFQHCILWQASSSSSMHGWPSIHPSVSFFKKLSLAKVKLSHQIKKSGRQNGTRFVFLVTKLEPGKKIHSPTAVFHSPMASRRPDFSSTAQLARILWGGGGGKRGGGGVSKIWTSPYFGKCRNLRTVDPYLNSCWYVMMFFTCKFKQGGNQGISQQLLPCNKQRQKQLRGQSLTLNFLKMRFPKGIATPKCTPWLSFLYKPWRAKKNTHIKQLNKINVCFSLLLDLRR